MVINIYKLVAGKELKITVVKKLPIITHLKKNDEVLKFKKSQNLVYVVTKSSFTVIGFVFALLMIQGCAANKQMAGNSNISLKEKFKNDFFIGAAINAQQIEEKDSAAAKLIAEQFNALTPENVMKAEIIHPGWDRYNFAMADKLVALAQKNNQVVNAHTLIWHSQLPTFVRAIKNVDSLRMFFTNHITTLAARYDGKVYSWDVVNEALNEDGSLRKSIFLQQLGENYIVDAFRLAGQAAPNTKLYYNDYNIEQPAKRAGAVALVKKIQQAGVRIDGIGIQGHWHLGKMPLKEIEESIQAFSALGIKVMFTELDISVLPETGNITGAEISQNAEYRERFNPYKNGLPDSVDLKLAQDYGDLFSLFMKYKGKISRVTFWGVTDGQSWLNNWPVRGRTNYPLLFNREYKPKKAFNVVMGKSRK